MSAPNDPTPNGVARWLAGFMIGAVFSTLGALGGNAINHEHRLTAVETRIDDYRQQLTEFRAEVIALRQETERVERKIDRILETKK